MKNIWFLLVLLVLFVYGGGRSVCAAESVPDSLLSVDYIQHIMLSDPDRVLTLLDTAEARNFPSLRREQVAEFRMKAYSEKGEYSVAAHYGKQVLEQDSVRKDLPFRLSVLRLMVQALIVQDRYKETIQFSEEGISLARQLGDKKEEAYFLMSMARVHVGMNQLDKGLSYYDQVPALLEETSDVREMAALSQSYGGQTTALLKAGKLEEAVEVCERRERVIRRMAVSQGPPPSYVDRQLGYLYSKKAFILQCMGKSLAAAEAYEAYNRTRFSHTPDGYNESIPYLLEVRRFEEALRKNDTCLAHFSGDTINYNYGMILNRYAQIYKGQGNYEQAYRFLSRVYVLQDSIYVREKEANAQEFALLFGAKEKERALREAELLSEQRFIVLCAVVFGSFLLCVLLAVIYAKLKETQRRNKIIFRQIEELMAREEALQKLYAQADSVGALPASEELPSSDDEEKQQDYMVFMRMENLIIQERLFLRSDFGRDELVAKTRINKNKLGQLLKDFTNDLSLSDHLNRLRVEYAVKLMKESPYLSINAIAEESGFSGRSTFYRSFAKNFGMSPAQYRDILKEK